MFLKLNLIMALPCLKISSIFMLPQIKYTFLNIASKICSVPLADLATSLLSVSDTLCTKHREQLLIHWTCLILSWLHVFAYIFLKSCLWPYLPRKIYQFLKLIHPPLFLTLFSSSQKESLNISLQITFFLLISYHLLHCIAVMGAIFCLTGLWII